ncbi:response regulator [Hirschia baltica]|uniref:Response regulator receiver protein n=1 Tax=Hirschia baltica (strain ATCC 49814 / DSM 5838 / IFAM 1418) TaxID=582402 RepID=C6XRW7_HIRBI|nr:hypothetical protein [Hirschia baltica]ACT60727.1 hypothetical protein Hbal_3059 [Hirschia baltica ATCC 49814]
MIEKFEAPKRDPKNQQLLIYSENIELVRMQRDMLKPYGVRNIVSATSPDEMMEQSAVHSMGTILVNGSSRVDPRKIISALRNEEKVRDPFAQVFFVTGSSSAQLINMIVRSGYDGILCLPFSRARLWKTIERMSETQRQFVRVGDYFGPDRRTAPAATPPKTEERRKEELLKKMGQQSQKAG